MTRLEKKRAREEDAPNIELVLRVCQRVCRAGNPFLVHAKASFSSSPRMTPKAFSLGSWLRRTVASAVESMRSFFRWIGQHATVAGSAVLAAATLAPIEMPRANPAGEIFTFPSSLLPRVLSVPIAYAQTAPRLFRVTPQLALARVCASEAGLTVTADCAGIHRVIERGAARQELSYLSMIRAYSDRVFATDRSDARAWVAHLRPDGRQPHSWPANVSWDNYRDAWRSLYAHAGELQRGERTAECEPDHWGCRTCGDQLRAHRAGWVEVSCGETANAFWRVPDRIEAAQIRENVRTMRRERYRARQERLSSHPHRNRTLAVAP